MDLLKDYMYPLISKENTFHQSLLERIVIIFNRLKFNLGNLVNMYVWVKEIKKGYLSLEKLCLNDGIKLSGLQN